MADGYKVHSINPSSYSLSSKSVLSRLDPKYYDPPVLQLIEKLGQNEIYHLSTVKKISSKINSGPFGSSLLASAYVSVGIPYFRPLNLKSIIASLDELVFITEEDWQRLRSSQFKSGDILVTKIGNGIGDVAIIPQGVDKANISGNLMGFRVTSGIDPYYIVTYLSSPFGQILIKRSLTDTAKPKIETSDIAAVNVPIPDPKIQAYIGDKVRLAERCREEAGKVYEEGQRLLDSNLDLPPIQEQKFYGWFIEPSKDMLFGRLNVQTYKPAYTMASRQLLEGGMSSVV